MLFLKSAFKSKNMQQGLGFMRSENASPLLYIYSNGKISLESREVFRTHPSHKMRPHCIYSKKSLCQSHFLRSSFLSFFLSLTAFTHSLKIQRVVTFNHTQRHTHVRWDSSGWGIGPSQRRLPHYARHSQETDSHSPVGIRTHNRSKRATTDPLLRQRSHWNRPRAILRTNKNHINFPGIKPGLPRLGTLSNERPCG
jgi:hypothetical protein